MTADYLHPLFANMAARGYEPAVLHHMEEMVLSGVLRFCRQSGFAATDLQAPGSEKLRADTVSVVLGGMLGEPGGPSPRRYANFDDFYNQARAEMKQLPAQALARKVENARVAIAVTKAAVKDDQVERFSMHSDRRLESHYRAALVEAESLARTIESEAPDAAAGLRAAMAPEGQDDLLGQRVLASLAQESVAGEAVEQRRPALRRQVSAP